MKRGVFIFGVLIVLLVFISAGVLGQGFGNPKDQLDDFLESAGKVETAIDKTRDFVTEGNLDYLGERWKATLLRYPGFAFVDTVLRNFNFVFVLLMSRNYTFSLGMFFAFLYWIMFLISIPGLFVLFPRVWARWLLGIGSTIILAHMQFFNSLSQATLNLIYYKFGIFWNILAIAIIIGSVTLYMLFLKKFEAYFAAKKKLEEEMARRRKIEKGDEFIETVKKSKKIKYFEKIPGSKF